MKILDKEPLGPKLTNEEPLTIEGTGEEPKVTIKVVDKPSVMEAVNECPMKLDCDEGPLCEDSRPSYAASRDPSRSSYRRETGSEKEIQYNYRRDTHSRETPIYEDDTRGTTSL